MKSWQKQYPPYEGEEPYLYYAFADADAKRVWPLMRLLLARGCRVWYAAGKAGSAEELLRRQKRASGAALTLVWLTDAARGDADLKSALLTNQSAGRPILCLDADEGDGGLSMGLYESTPHLSACTRAPRTCRPARRCARRSWRSSSSAPPALPRK